MNRDVRALKPQTFQILLALADQDLHGTAIMEEVLERTDGDMKLWPGTLYGSLRELSSADLIAEIAPPAGAPIEGGKRRFYRITPDGRTRLRAEVERLAGLIRVARAKSVADDLEPV